MKKISNFLKIPVFVFTVFVLFAVFVFASNFESGDTLTAGDMNDIWNKIEELEENTGDGPDSGIECIDVSSDQEEGFYDQAYAEITCPSDYYRTGGWCESSAGAQQLGGKGKGIDNGWYCRITYDVDYPEWVRAHATCCK